MENKYIQVVPNKLYPLTMVTSIEPQNLQECVKLLESGEQLGAVKAFYYEDILYMLEGCYEMLAHNILKKEAILVELVDRTLLPFWNEDENLVKNFKVLGMSTLYDFEAIGGFRYEEYPLPYKR